MIYLVRHGETVWNTLGRFQGQKDSPLTKRGIEQARVIGELLAREGVGAAHPFEMQISPLGRAQETAAHIQGAISQRAISSQKRLDVRLMEVTTGSWDGLTLLEIGNEHPDRLDGADAFDWYFRSPDGEGFETACLRARSWLADVREPTIAVSHGLFGRLIRGIYLDLSRREMLELPVPQDGFYCLSHGGCKLIGGGVAEGE